MEYLFEKYKESKCRCFTKGGNEPSLVIKENYLPYFISNYNPKLNTLSHFLCKDITLINSVFIASILLKVYYNKLNYYLGYEIIKNYNQQEFLNGILIFTLIANIGTLTAVLNSGFSKLRSSTEVKQDITQDHRNLTVKLNAVNTYSTNQQLSKLNTVHREIIKFGTHYVESAGRITQTPTTPSNEDLQDGQEQEEE